MYYMTSSFYLFIGCRFAFTFKPLGELYGSLVLIFATGSGAGGAENWAVWIFASLGTSTCYPQGFVIDSSDNFEQ